MTADYRSKARQSVERAKSFLAGDIPGALRTAALDLRDALEFIIYERMLQYKDEIAPKEYEDWLADDVLHLLREIDPQGDVRASIFFQTKDKERPEKGGEQPIEDTADRPTHSDLNEHYQALERFLHIPTVKQIRTKHIPKETELKAKCQASIDFIERVLSASIPDADPAVFASFVCARCKLTVMRRVPAECNEPITAGCVSCGARYVAASPHAEKLQWVADTLTIECGTKGCTYGTTLWPEQVSPGTAWVCAGCKSHWVLYLAWGKLEPRRVIDEGSKERNASEGDDDAKT